MKTAIITGGSSGIGSAIVKELQNENWTILVPTHDELDLSKLDGLGTKVDELTEKLGTIDALIHVAGIWHDDRTAFKKDLENYSEEEISSTLNVGLTSFMILASRVLPKMPKDGRVIGISGTFADGASGWLPYYVSKRGLEDMIVGLAQDYAHGPQVFGISPADTATEAYATFFPEYISDAQPAEAVAREVMTLLHESKLASGTIVELRQGDAAKGFHQ